MRSRLMPILAAAMVLLMWRAASDQVGAKLIRDDKAGPANPVTEAGGLRLVTPIRLPVPYSLIGAIANESRPVGSCEIWPWRLFNGVTLHRHGPYGGRTLQRLDDALMVRRPWIR